LAEEYARLEQEAIENGDYEEVLVDEFCCTICNKKFKAAGGLLDADFEANLAADR
jgi:hypothetical protein